MHVMSTDYKAAATKSHLLPVKRLSSRFQLLSPWTGFLLPGRSRGGNGTGGGQPGTRCPAPRGSTASSHGQQRLGWEDRGSGDPGGQSCPSEVAFNLPANNMLF